ncbi:MAG: lipid-binding SYLF domain-containing protein [Pirellulales bacterium]
MSKLRWPVALLVVGFALAAPATAQADPEETIRAADQVLHEGMDIPVRQIPTALLSDAQGIAIIPDVLKIGFVAAVRRGHGVVMVREPNGAWSLPQFVTLTGGSVGWQAGVQGTDVVLVFMTRKSVEGLLRGKFTIGADAAAAAGPIGRNAAAATDARMKAEILSYSRSRGLFAGLALDGSVIEINPVAQTSYYGAGPGQQPVQVPESAAKLVADLTQMAAAAQVQTAGVEGQPLDGAGAPQPAAPGQAQPTSNLAPIPGVPQLAVPAGTSVREALAARATALQAELPSDWQRFLALPREVYEGQGPPSVESLQQSLRQFDRVANDPQYQALNSRAEFQATYKLLREYARQLSDGSKAQLRLPPPPLR